MTGDYFVVSASDGQAKRWPSNGEWYSIPAGGSGVFPGRVARHAVKFYSVHEDQEPVCTILTEPFAGEVEFVSSRTAFKDEDGTEYATLGELIAAVKARVAPVLVAPVVPPDADLERLVFVELVKLAGVHGLEVSPSTSKKDLIALLGGQRAEEAA